MEPEEGNLPHPGGLGPAFFPASHPPTPPTNRLPTPLTGAGKTQEGEARSRKLGLRKQVPDNHPEALGGGECPH